MNIDDESRIGLIDTAVSREERVDFETEASVIHRLGKNESNVIVDPRTGENLETLARLISRAKYGEIQAAWVLANRIFRGAIIDENFLRFIREEHDKKCPIILTSHGVFNVPTASKLIIDRIAGLLNTFLHRKGFAGVLLDRPIPLQVEEAFFTSRSDSHIQIPKPHAIVTPGEFKGQSVIFVDDMCVEKRHADEMKQLLIKEGQASRVYFLYGSELVGDNPEELEKAIANRHFSGQLDSIEKLLMEPNSFMVVKRLLQAVMNPENMQQLPAFLSRMPDETLIKLYDAVNSADFRLRYHGRYVESTMVLEMEMFNRGWVDANGFLFETRKLKNDETEGEDEPHRVICHSLNTRQDIPFEEAEIYSLMKYGDPSATRYVAEQMARVIVQDSVIQDIIETQGEIIICASAYGEVKTAAAHLVDCIEAMISAAGIKIVKIKADRKGSFATQNFGQLTHEQRKKEMKKRVLSLFQSDGEYIEGKTVLVIDDLCATGSHEQAMKKLLQRYNAQSVFSYYIQFSETLRVNEPDTEEWLNRAAMVSLKDLYYRLVMMLLAEQT